MDTNKLIVVTSSIALSGAAALLLLSNVSNTLSTKEYELRLAKQKSQIEYLQEELDAATQELDKFINPIQYRRDAVPTYDLPLSEELQHYTYEMCSYYDIADHYEAILGLMWRESTFNTEAVSKTNDYGIMQINECNHEYLKNELGIVDIMDAKSNIESGIYILSTLIHEYGDLHKALMAYNMGPSGAAALWDRGIYTSAYSRDILAKADQICSNNYFQKDI